MAIGAFVGAIVGWGIATGNLILPAVAAPIGIFLEHLATYIIVNVFLIFVNLSQSPENLWFPWVLASWGIGLAFHFVFSRERFVVAEWEKKAGRVELRARKRHEKP